MTVRKKKKTRSRGSRTRFEYRRRKPSSVEERANQRGGRFDSMFSEGLSVWTPKEGNNRIRFLPPTWKGAKHYGFDIYVHYSVGSDNQRYLCLEEMRGETCPICEERRRAEADGADSQYINDLSPKKRILCFIVDRDDEKAGVQLWPSAWTLDRDISTLCYNKRTKECLFIDDPEEGYDVEFTKKGKTRNTEYLGIQVDRRPSPLSDDEDQAEAWLAFVTEHPLPDCFLFHEADHIAQVAMGKVAADEDEEEEEDERPRRRRTKKSRRQEEDLEDEEDEEDLEDEEDEEDLEDEEDEEDEDEEPPRRRRTKKAKRGSVGRSKSKRRRLRREEEEDDEDLDEEEEEEDLEDDYDYEDDEDEEEPF